MPILLLILSLFFTASHTHAESCANLSTLAHALTTQPKPNHYKQCLLEAETALKNEKHALTQDLAQYPYVLQEAVKAIITRDLGRKENNFQGIKTYQLAVFVKKFLIDKFSLAKLPQAVAKLQEKASDHSILHNLPQANSLKNTIIVLCSKHWNDDLDMRWHRFLVALNTLPNGGETNVAKDYQNYLQIVKKYAPSLAKELASTAPIFKKIMDKVYRLKSETATHNLSVKDMYKLIINLQHYRWLNTPYAKGHAQAYATCVEKETDSSTCQKLFEGTAFAIDVMSALQSFAEDITFERCHIR